LRSAGQRNHRSEESLKVEFLFLRRVRPAAVHLVNLLHPNVAKLMSDPLDRLASHQHQRRVAVPQVVEHPVRHASACDRLTPWRVALPRLSQRLPEPVAENKFTS